MLIEGLTVFFIFLLLFSVCLFGGIRESLDNPTIDDIRREKNIGKNNRGRSKRIVEELKKIINDIEDGVVEVFYNTEDIKDSAIRIA
tara:strand:- start:6696 stop:6956 length:261 start_codon:yes stop_codon:yes gene_type:complete